MALSFTLAAAEKPSLIRRKVLVTGAAGNIGSYFSQHSKDRYELRLMIRGDEKKEKVAAIRGLGKIVSGDLGNLDHLAELCQGIDTVLHLAANPSYEATWGSILNDNIIGTYNLFVAAKNAGCRRVIFASSIPAISGYPSDMQVKTADPVNPGDLYGVSKCFGEAMARYMAEKERLSAVAIRIGAFQPTEAAKDEGAIGMMDAWVSRRDLTQLIHCCIDDTRLQFAIFHGLSNNRFKRMDISDAREMVGYRPMDDLTEVNAGLKALHLKDKVVSHSMADKGTKSGLRDEVKRGKRNSNSKFKI
jgi:UDP-glucose 4-epimerase